MTIWSTEERAGLGNTAGYIQKLILAPQHRETSGSGTFDLYYFVPNFKDDRDDKRDRAILFCLGGPGRVLKPHDHLWFKELSLIGYKIVYFHLRGSGFSQFSEFNSADQFIRTEYAADDMEHIRQDFLGKDSDKQWDAVIGYSYGAVLAQQYAHQYMERVKKLILIGPISLDAFVTGENAADVYEEYAREVKKIRELIIDKIYDLRIFNDKKSDVHISVTDKQRIKDKLFSVGGVLEKIENNFGSEQSVMDYWEVVNGEDAYTHQNLLESAGLAYPFSFFQALRELHLYGCRTDNDGAVNQEAKLAEIGEVIASGLGILPPNSCQCHPQHVAIITNAPRSRRVFEVMGVYDGLNRRFIKEWISKGRTDVANCIKLAAGSAWTRDYPGKNVGITQKTTIEPWSPAYYPHNKSTLVLKGSADPVTAAGQAESYMKRDIIGSQSILLTFDGVGHEFILPGVEVQSPDIHPNLRGGNADTLNCLIYAFVENDFDRFKNIAQPIWKALKAEEMDVQAAKPI